MDVIDPDLDLISFSRTFPANRPRLRRDPPVFEIGLTLGGTVSAGAYAAGVLDHLMEALDAWALSRQKGEAVPPHDVCISTIGGTSGGAINGGILLRAAGWDYPHGPHPENPFCRAWTTGVDLAALLRAEHRADGQRGFRSLFDAEAIDRQAEAIIGASGRALGEASELRARPYLADPLRLIMMVGNITGVPYRIALSNDVGLAHDMREHADAVRFALEVPGGFRNEPGLIPGFEIDLRSREAENWPLLREAALATSAFPLAFPSRALRRRLDSFLWRAVAVPEENGVRVLPLRPHLKALRDIAEQEMVPSVHVDGGVINNEPLDMVRTALAGLAGRNPRGAMQAHRAVLLVDPFSGPEKLGPHLPPEIPKLLLPFVMALIYQARFKPMDVALALQTSIYSRFLIAPAGPWDSAPEERRVGDMAIAAGGLGGFLGFFDSSFLDHDFRLGRRNAHDFLARHFVLPAGHALFRDWPEDAYKRACLVERPNGPHLPIIPLMQPLRDAPPEMPQHLPKLDAWPAAMDRHIERRLDAVFRELRDWASPSHWFWRWTLHGLSGLAWRLAGRRELRKAAADVLRKALEERSLLDPPRDGR